MAEESDEEEDYCCTDDNYLQACYVLQGASSERTELSPLPQCLKDEPKSCGQWRKDAFDTIWMRIESAVQNVLEEKNADCFKGIKQWILNKQFCKAQMSLYMSRASVTRVRLDSAILFSGSLETSDSSSVFDSLAEYLKKGNHCRVARLQPSNLQGRNGVHATLRSLLNQFIGVTPETTDMEILAAWHRERSNNKFPLVVILEDAEHSNSSLLAELVVILSEWAEELPLALILGMATTGESLRMLLPASVMDRLQLQCFSLKSPLERLEAVIQAILIDCPFMFTWGSDVVKFFYELFYTHDNTVTSFLRVLKVSCMEHFCKQPLSFLCLKLVQSTTQVDFEEVCSKLPTSLLRYSSTLSSTESGASSKNIAEALWQYKSNRRCWSMAFQCFLAAGKHSDFVFSDVYYGTLTSSKPSVVNTQTALSQITEKLRLLPVSTIAKLVEEWMEITVHDSQCRQELQVLQKQFLEASNAESPSTTPLTKSPLEKFPSANTRRLRSLMGCSSPATNSQNQITFSSPQRHTRGTADQKATLVKLAMDFLERLQREAPETFRFHEVFCFKDVDALKKALTGETRKLVHSDLLSSQSCLKCVCCPSDGSLSSSLHDTAIAYMLSQEHNELVNVHDWFQSFELIQSQGKSVPKRQRCKRKTPDAEVEKSEKARNQARFCRAVSELHVTGLLRLPKKRHPDSVQRIAFGL